MSTKKERQIFYTVRIGEKLFDITGRKRTPKGSVVICIHGHPNADVHGYVMEHRVVMETALGRFLRVDEAVHHRNQVKHDNRISNLQIISPGEHTRLHHLGSKRGEDACKKMSEVAKRRFREKTSHPSYKNIDNELIDMVENGYTAGVIAKRLGVTRKTVYNKLEYLGVRSIYDKQRSASRKIND